MSATPEGASRLSEGEPVAGVDGLVATGQDALGRAAWGPAKAAFEAAVATTDSPEAWEGLSRAAWWQGDQERTMTARESAYRGYRRVGDAYGAARMAMWLASDHLDFRGDEAVASAWLRRGWDLVGDLEPSTEQGNLLVLEADIALLNHSDPATAERLSRQALDIGRAVPDSGVEVIALAILGSAEIAAGRVSEGVRRLEECASLAVTEEFGDAAAPGWALCHTVTACADVGDFARAEQWCRAMHAWSATWQARHFFGICRTAYGDVLATCGDWSSAEEELTSAMEDLSTTRPGLAAPAAVRLGCLRARQGDLAEARRLFESALPLPSAIVSLGGLDLDAGDPTAAADAAERALRRLGQASVLERFSALELLAEAHAAAGDAAEATAAADQVELDATQLATPYMRGRGRLVRARVLSAAAEHDGARQAAEDAVDLFTSSAAPYEAAESRMVLAAALEALGRVDRAAAEAQAAREAFALLGTAAVGEPVAREALSAREIDILRLVAHGMSNAQIADRLFLSPHTVHRHVANIRTKLDVPSRAAAVGYATRHGLL
ncbi:MAG TPA: LuxR C-terminal-related transcriptional regulator [Nocardioidaceae bacterium]|nr:LuxR C-terminal-related transcriptional regulator [Nocardioidaceae bacterium]